MLACNTKWGFPGLMMGTDPWGTVMHLTGNTDNDWNNYLAKACSEAESAASSTAEAPTTFSTVAAVATQIVHQGLGTQSVVSSTHVASSSTTSSARPSSTFTTSTRRTTSSTSTTSTTQAKPTTTSTSTKPKPTTTSTTTTHTTPKATPTADSNTNSFTGSSDSGDSGNTNSNSGNTNSNSGTTANTSGTSANTNTNTGSSSSGGDNGSRASDADVQTYLSTHNTIRSQHGAVPVTWSNAAAVKAQQWADECKNQHSGGTLGPLGENLAAGTGSFSITNAVKAWTDEVSEYNANDPQPSHFTQVVWKATTQIGCAVATCNGIFAGFGAAQYYVCEYSVQGNVIGNFGANVQA